MADGVSHVRVRNDYLAREPCYDVAAARDGFEPFSGRCDGRDSYFYFFGGFAAYDELELVPCMTNDVCIKTISCDAHVPRINDTAEAYNADVGRAAADVDDHAPAGLMNGKFDPNRRRERFLDDVHFARAPPPRRRPPRPGAPPRVF